MRFLLVLLLASPTHVEPTVAEAPAGSRAELGFTVEHGCGGSPTVEVAMQLPAEVADPEPVELPGWTATVDDRVVTWAGGPLPDGEAATFTVSVGLPATPGVTLLFPTVQTCEAGELAWIAEDGGATEADNPAPRIVLTDLDPADTTSTTAAPASPTEDGDEDENGPLGWFVLGAGVVAGAAALVSIRRRGSGDRPRRS